MHPPQRTTIWLVVFKSLTNKMHEYMTMCLSREISVWIKCGPLFMNGIVMLSV